MAQLLVGLVVGGALIAAVNGGKKEEIRTEVSNTINNYVKQTNENVFKILNETTLSISTNFINNQESKIAQNNAVGNEVYLSGVTVKSGGTLNIVQYSELISYATALISITTDNSLSSQMTQQIVEGVTNQIKQDTDLENDLKAVNAIEKTKTTQGEFNNLINKVTDLLATGDKKDTTSITNIINNQFEQIQKTEVEFKDILNNFIKTEINNDTVSNCLSQTSSFNKANIKDLLINDDATVYVNQNSLENNFYSCYLNNIVNNTAMYDLISSTYKKVDNTSDQSASAKNSMDVSNSIKIIEKTTSIITEMLQTIIYVIVAIAILGFIILVGVPGTEALKKPIVSLFSKMKKAPPEVKSETVSEVAKAAMKYFIGY